MVQPTTAEIVAALDGALADLSRALVETGTAERDARECGLHHIAAAAGRWHEAACNAAFKLAALRERLT